MDYHLQARHVDGLVKYALGIDADSVSDHVKRHYSFLLEGTENVILTRNPDGLCFSLSYGTECKVRDGECILTDLINDKALKIYEMEDGATYNLIDLIDQGRIIYNIPESVDSKV
ncbi:MAG: hypothetical protein ACI83O_000310 [Patescibacteria group bacterium]|jgi:hypothetical protein